MSIGAARANGIAGAVQSAPLKTMDKAADQPLLCACETLGFGGRIWAQPIEAGGKHDLKVTPLGKSEVGTIVADAEIERVDMPVLNRHE